MKRALGQKTLSMIKEWALYFTQDEWAGHQKKIAEICDFVADRMMNQDPTEFAKREAEILVMHKEAKKLKRR